MSLGGGNLDVVTGMIYSNPRDEHLREEKRDLDAQNTNFVCILKL